MADKNTDAVDAPVVDAPKTDAKAPACPCVDGYCQGCGAFTDAE